MIKIEKLRLKNFKSFKKATIPFSEGFTTIAGSNGSGKSNILDAILFVMGITSLKMLRASRLTDLVNNQANENYAQAEMTLKDGEREFEINRTVDKSGKSIYRLNGKRCTLNEINSFLGEINLSADGHNIVVQGDITKIISMNFIQRREIIDEIAGLTEFDEKKQDALKDLDKVDQKIKETRIVLNEREAYLSELEKEREAAQKYRDLNLKLRQSKATFFFKEIQSFKNELNEALQKEKSVQEKMNQKSAEKEQQRRNIENYESRFNEINEDLIKSSQNNFEELATKNEQKKSIIKISGEKINFNKIRMNKNLERISELKNEKASQLEENNEKKEKIKSIKEETKSFQEKINQLKKEKENKAKIIENKNAVAFEKEEKLKKIHSMLIEKNEKTFYIKSELNSLKKEEEMKEKEISLLNERREKLSLKAELFNELTQEKKILIESYKDPSQKLINETNNLGETIRKLGLNENILSEINDSIKKLNEIKGLCPTCSQELEKITQNRLLSEKKTKLIHANENIKLLNSRKENIEKEIEKLSKVKSKIESIEVQLKDLSESKQELSKVKEKLISLKEKEFSKAIEQNEFNLGRTLNELKELKEQKIESEKELTSMNLKEKQSELHEISENLSELKDSLNEKVHALSRLEIEVKESEEKLSKYSKQEIEMLEKENNEFSQKNEAEEDIIVKEKSDLKEIEIALQKLISTNKAKLDEKIEVNKKLHQSRQKFEEITSLLAKMNHEMNEIQIKKSTSDMKVTDLEEEFKEFKEEKILESSSAELKKEIPKIELELQKIGEVNMKSISGYNEFKQEVDDIKKKSEKLDEERLKVMELISKIEVKRKSIFMDCFEKINNNYSKMYRSLSGGEGRLTLTDSENPLESGLLIEARHTGTTLKELSSMSGGEKSLTALAFLFAIQLYEPSPFYIFDEADAALDKTNSKKLAKMVKEISEISQFIAITHNDAMIEESDQIIGVTLNEAKSSVIGLKIKKEAQASMAAN